MTRRELIEAVERGDLPSWIGQPDPNTTGDPWCRILWYPTIEEKAELDRYAKRNEGGPMTREQMIDEATRQARRNGPWLFRGHTVDELTPDSIGESWWPTDSTVAYIRSEFKRIAGDYNG